MGLLAHDAPGEAAPPGGIGSWVVESEVAAAGFGAGKGGVDDGVRGGGGELQGIGPGGVLASVLALQASSWRRAAVSSSA